MVEEKRKKRKKKEKKGEKKKKKPFRNQVMAAPVAEVPQTLAASTERC